MSYHQVYSTGKFGQAFLFPTVNQTCRLTWPLQVTNPLGCPLLLRKSAPSSHGTHHTWQDDSSSMEQPLLNPSTTMCTHRTPPNIRNSLLVSLALNLQARNTSLCVHPGIPWIHNSQFGFRKHIIDILQYIYTCYICIYTCNIYMFPNSNRSLHENAENRELWKVCTEAHEDRSQNYFQRNTSPITYTRRHLGGLREVTYTNYPLCISRRC